MVNTAIATKMKNLEKPIFKHGLWDKIVFKKMAAALGGRVRLMTTGSAPLDPIV